MEEGDGVKGGIELLRSEIIAAMESARQQAQELAVKIAQEVLQELATGAKAHLKTLVEDAEKKIQPNKKAADEVIRCFKTVRKALKTVKGVLEKIKPALKQASGVSRKLHVFLTTLAKLVQGGLEDPPAKEALTKFLTSRLGLMIKEVLQRKPKFLNAGEASETARDELQRRVEMLGSALDFVQRSQSVVFAVVDQISDLKLGEVKGGLPNEKIVAALKGFGKKSDEAANGLANLKSLLAAGDLSDANVQAKYTDLMEKGSLNGEAIWAQLQGVFEDVCAVFGLPEPITAIEPQTGVPKPHDPAAESEPAVPRDLKVVLLRIDQLASSLDASLDIVANLSSVVGGADSLLERLEGDVRRVLTARDKDRELIVKQIQDGLFGAVESMLSTPQDSNADQTLMYQLSSIPTSFSKLLARFDHLLLDVQGVVDFIPEDLPGLSDLAAGVTENMADTMSDLKKEGAKIKVFVSEQVGELWEEMSADIAEKTGAAMETAEDAEEFIETYSGIFSAALDAATSIASLAKSTWGRRSTKAQAEMWRARDRAVFQLMLVQEALALPPVPDDTQTPTVVVNGSDGQTAPPSGLPAKVQQTNILNHVHVQQTEPNSAQMGPRQQGNGGTVHAADDAIGRLDGVSNEEKLMSLAMITDCIMSRRIKETKPGVKKTLESTAFAKQFQRTMKDGLKSSEQKLKDELMEQMKTVVELEKQLRFEPDPTKRQVGLITLHKERATLRTIFANVQVSGDTYALMLPSMCRPPAVSRQHDTDTCVAGCESEAERDAGDNAFNERRAGRDQLEARRPDGRDEGAPAGHPTAGGDAAAGRARG
eukprot:350028-Rhodomonas_salina.1